MDTLREAPGRTLIAACGVQVGSSDATTLRLKNCGEDASPRLSVAV